MDELRPVDIWEMWKGWRWRWSRDLEAQMTAAAIGSWNPKAIDPIKTCKTFHDYLPDPRREDPQ